MRSLLKTYTVVFPSQMLVEEEKRLKQERLDRQRQAAKDLMGDMQGAAGDEAEADDTYCIDIPETEDGENSVGGDDVNSFDARPDTVLHVIMHLLYVFC